MHAGAAFALKAFEAGAAGYVTKSSAPSEIVRAVGLVARGGRALSEDIAREIAADRLSSGQESGPAVIRDLGPREVEILRLVASGETSEAIARRLNLSQKTVQNYHYGIKAKIGAHTDAHLVWLAIGAGLLEIERAP